jgi:hypothetical protein
MTVIFVAKKHPNDVEIPLKTDPHTVYDCQLQTGSLISLTIDGLLQRQVVV